MLKDAGFGKVEVKEVDGDAFNYYYIARKWYLMTRDGKTNEKDWEWESSDLCPLVPSTREILVIVTNFN